MTVTQWSTGNPKRPSDDNHHCVGFCNGSSDEWCDESCSFKFTPLCEGTENQIEALKTKVSENSEKIDNIAYNITGCPIKKTWVCWGAWKVLFY